MSAPILNRHIPTIRITAEKRKVKISLVVKFTSGVKLSIKIIKVIGRGSYGKVCLVPYIK